jgi:predicted peroxiredoxin
MAEAGHVPAQEKLHQLRSLGAQIDMCGPSMDRFEVSRESLVFDGLPLIEYLTFMTVMEDADIHLYT